MYLFALVQDLVRIRQHHIQVVLVVRVVPIVVQEAEHHREADRHRLMVHENRAVERLHSIQTGLEVHRIIQIDHVAELRTRIILNIRIDRGVAQLNRLTQKVLHRNLVAQAEVHPINHPVAVEAVVLRKNLVVGVVVPQLNPKSVVKNGKDKF